MDKAINGDGWAFKPATADAPAIWAGKDSIFHVWHKRRAQYAAFWAFAAPLVALVVVGGYLGALGGLLGEISEGKGQTGDMMAIAAGVVLLVLHWLFRKPLWALIKAGAKILAASMDKSKFFGSAWRLSAVGDDLTYRGDSDWSVSVDEIARVESGQTVEWERARKYPDTLGRSRMASIPDAEMQVFLFTSDGRRLVVHTANAAREDCGRLAHSIRSYVEAQRGNAAPSPSDPSSPHNVPDGFDL